MFAAKFLLSLLALALLVTTQTSGIEQLQRSFERPPDDARIMMRWWWFGPAVTKPQLEHEMLLMKEGGIGGFEVQPVYPVALDDTTTGVKTLPFLSDEFIDALRFTSEKARDLGLRVDLTIGSGWPYGGSQVPIREASARLRSERVKITDNSRRIPVPDIAAGEKLVAAFLGRVQANSIAPESIREMTQAIRDGALWLPADLAGSNEVFFFIASRTGQMVKRASVGSEGYVLDHYDRTAIDNYLKNTGDRLMLAFGSRPPFAIFCDSLEVYENDWTGDLLEEFRKRRGYDLKPHLPALVADVGTKTAAIRHDWGLTLTDLLHDRFLAPVRDWSRSNKTLFRIQGYGVPPAILSSNAYADLPEGEGPQWKTLRQSRWASSASHLYGRSVTSSETWTWLHSPVFRATPLDVKAEADLHFLQGVNQLIGHGWPYTAEGVGYPGWRFYAAGVFNEKNPWWIVMPDLSRYLQRISFLMRQGQPANDIALYLPNHDAWASMSSGKIHMIEILREHLGADVIPRILETGYNLDFFDDEALKQVGRVENGQLTLGGNRYTAVILPSVSSIPLRTMKTLEEFANGGGILIATKRKPTIAPGFLATETEHNQISELSRSLFEGASARAHFVEDENRQLGSTLTRLLRPDVLLSPAVPEIGFIHRKTADAEIYFVVNSSAVRQNTRATFRVDGLTPEWWDPFTGGVSVADYEVVPQGGVAVQSQLEPYESRVIVFSKRNLQRRAPASGLVNLPAPIDLSNTWQVRVGSKTATMERLQSWTDVEETRYYSGLGTYEKEIVVPEGFLQKSIGLRLDFGEGQPAAAQPQARAGMQAWLEAPVREAAVVYVNDRRVGSVWCPPYSLDIGDALRAGTNRLRIVVGNLAINHMAGRRLPDYRLLNLRYGVRFEPQEMNKVQVVPAGLLGPIRLIPFRK